MSVSTPQLPLSKRTLTLPSMSDFTGVNATEPRTSADHQLASAIITTHRGSGNIPNKVVNDSAASKNSVVATALSFSLSTGTSVKDFLRVSRKVPPSGYACAAIVFVVRVGCLLDFGRTSC